MYKVTLLSLLIGCTWIAAKPMGDVHEKTITDETLRQVFEKAKQFLSHDMGFNYQNKVINTTDVLGNVTLTEVHLIDPMAYTIPTTKVDMTALTFLAEINYPALQMYGNYDLLIESDLFKLPGNGSFSIDIKDLKILLSWKFNLTNEQTLVLEYFHLEYNLTIEVNISNLGGDETVSQVLNDLINQILPATIETTKDDVDRSINEAAKTYSRFVFDGMTVDEFVTHVYEFLDMKKDLYTYIKK